MQEKVYIVADASFGKLEGHILIFDRALYGLHSSAARWHKRFATALREVGLVHAMQNTDLWMKTIGNTISTLPIYVNDMALHLTLYGFCKQLKERFGFKLKEWDHKIFPGQ